MTTDDLPNRHLDAERFRQLSQRVEALATGGGSPDNIQIEDDDGQLRYEAGRLSDGTYGIRIYNSSGVVIWSAP